MKQRPATLVSGSRRGAIAVVLAATLFITTAATTVPQAAAARPANTHLASSTGRAFAVSKPEVSCIHNFAEIEPGLARGARLTDEGIEYLRTHGYRTVVAFWSPSDERERLKRAGIDYVSIPMRANAFGAPAPTQAQIDSFLSVASDSARRPVYFHCKAGKDRTGVMAAVYRMERQGWPRADAAEEMRAFGFHGYYRNLYGFVTNYASRARTPGATEAALTTSATSSASAPSAAAASTTSAPAAPSASEAQR